MFGAFFARGIFADQDEVLRKIANFGFKEIQIVDHSWFFVGPRGCGGADAARFTVKAVNPSGQRAEFYVCSRWPFNGIYISMASF